MQKQLVRVKFTGNPYSYVCERLLYRHWNARQAPGPVLMSMRTQP